MAYYQNNSQRSNDEVRFDLMEHIGVLSMKDSGWTREVNIVSWNGAPAKVDIREWNPEHSRMSRGITLFEEEAETLTKALARRYGLRLKEDKEPARRQFFNEENDRSFVNEKQPAVMQKQGTEAVPMSEITQACVEECIS